MARILVLAALLAGCDSGGEAEGFVVVPEGECHELARTQCECCGDNQPSCRATVDFRVVSEGAFTASTEEECAARRAEVGDDVQAWCDTNFVSPTERFDACQGFPPPTDSPDTTDTTAGD